MIFSPSAPETVAFAVNRGYGSSIETQQLAIHLGTGERTSPLQILSRQGSHTLSKTPSDMLCVEFLNNTTTVNGHRNGSISMIDHRSGSASYIISKQEQQSNCFITSLLTFSEQQHCSTSSHYTVIAKGSFGTNFIFDIRNMGHRNNTNKCAVGGRCTKPSTLLYTLSVPDENGRGAHGVKSSNCSGLAVDPTGTILISPFIDNNRDIRFGIWTIDTGRFLKSLAVDQRFGSPVQPLYCELSQNVTHACMFQQKVRNPAINNLTGPYVTKESWGLWFKCGALARNAPEEISGVHHVVFDGHHLI